jgi:hypothetical protein
MSVLKKYNCGTGALFGIIVAMKAKAWRLKALENHRMAET